VHLVGETHAAAGPAGPAERYDYEYVRNGRANLFLVFQPLLGVRKLRT
jgi:hypothetical protein